MAAVIETMERAVQLLLTEHGLRADIVNSIKTEARNPASRLAGIRDVALYVLPDYIPDLRRRLDAGIEADLAAWAAFKVKYEVDERFDLAAIERDFPNLPEAYSRRSGLSHYIKFHDGTVTFVGEYRFATYRDCLLMRVRREINYLGNGGLYDVRNNLIFINGGWYTYTSAYRPLYVLPCGLVIVEDLRTPVNTFVMNLATLQTVQIDKANLDVYDDYGTGRDLPDKMYEAVGAHACFARVNY